MSAVPFVAQMKLRRLREQREVLLARYDALDAEATRAPNDAARLRVLYEGLRAMDIAGSKLHPEVCNLDATLVAADCGHVDRGALARLEAEVRAGRLRCNVMYAFGSLLEQWASSRVAREEPPDHDARARALLARKAARVDLAFVDGVLARVDPKVKEAIATFQGSEEEPPLVNPHAVETSLKHLAEDGERKPRLRAEARRFSSDAELQKDLVDALPIMLEERPWDWPEQGVALRSVWTGDRHRLHLDEDLVTGMVLDLVALHWSHMGSMLRSNVAVRKMRVDRLRQLNAPAAVLENEERLLASATGILFEEDLLGKDIEARSLAFEREAQLRSLQSASLSSAVGYEYGGGVRTLVGVVHAELACARAASPSVPVFAVKTDIEDFFPSVDHELVVRIADHLGVPPRWRDFFRRYLRVAVAHDGGVQHLERGLPLGHDLSRLFAEMLLAVVELHVRRGLHGVRMFRLVDDIVLVSQSPADLTLAWQRLEEAMAACGLALSASKSGTLGLGARPPTGLPRGPFRIGVLELGEDGQWSVADEALGQAIELAGSKLREAPSVLEAVYTYNKHLRRLVSALVLSLPLGAAWVERAGRALDRFQRELFDGHLAPAITARVGADLFALLPKAWVHWPLTAGGLGVVDPFVEIAPFAAPRKLKVPAPSAAPDLETSQNDFADYYRALLEPAAPRAPDANPLVDGLAADFVKRKAEMAGRTPDTTTELAPYWRWILSTHGPAILAAFGTYRFLLHELLPIHLIRSGRQPARASTDADDMPSRAPDPDADIPF